jgi:hypothetical protein
MHTVFVALPVIALLAVSSLQADSPPGDTASSIVEAPYEPDYAKGIPERQEWRRLRKVFLKKKLPLILRKYRDQLRCTTCIEAYMDVSFSVSLTGSVSIHKVDAERVCGGPFPPAMRDEFFAFLKDYPYPKLLLGKTVRLRLGTAFKCGELAGN